MHRCIVTVILLAISGSTAFAANAEFFEARIRPVLVEYCYSCHNSTKSAEGDLAVDFRDGLLKGGSGGELIVPGKPERSRLIAILKHEVEGLEMPNGNGNPVDKLIGAKLNEVGLSPAKPAETAVLIRRLYFQLIGLPLTTAELKDWMTRYTVARIDR